MIKNARRITEHIGADEPIQTVRGGRVVVVPGRVWCRREAKRLKAAGIPAEAREVGGSWYVVRSGAGCCGITGE